ncbi:hypothetical protein GCM10023320_63090 [Pseudonocardia adelaidensis]|uniref:Uncharacterized protein n=1 Tax=Pseudonocardia adelaidensis TaxID=648754 RepID=A0ABP9NVL5_9PSEU
MAMAEATSSGARQLVAKDESYYADEGVDVEFVTKGYANAGIAPLEDHELLSSFGATKSHFESGEASLYRACEWGQIRRVQDTTIGGRVVSKRAAVNSQAIMVRPDAPGNHPQDLATTRYWPGTRPGRSPAGGRAARPNSSGHDHCVGAKARGSGRRTPTETRTVSRSVFTNSDQNRLSYSSSGAGTGRA